MDGSGSHFHTGTTDTSGNHSHTYFGVQDQGVLGGGTDKAADDINRPPEDTGIAGIHSHTFTTNTVSDHRHNLNDPTHRHAIASNGGNQPHNNLQPTIYMGNLFIYCGRVVHNVTDADGINPPAVNVSYYPPSVPANRLY